MGHSACYESKEGCDNEQGGFIFLQDNLFDEYFYSKFNCLWTDGRLNANYSDTGSSGAVVLLEGLITTLTNQCED